ncbi:MAG: nitroreductase family protein, partial [Candidatus Krumholzibacteriota bacterium]|nr:nitroreductase family protein [Candidatus Krumholzibacteriota bacterium]
MRSRRTVRHFSSKAVPREALLNCIETAAQAPSGANKQPWSFVLVSDAGLKKNIREGAEQEEREHYGGRASERWLLDLEPLGTDENKPFIETAPALIAVFAQRFGTTPDDQHYYVNESVGIAVGFLLAALHNAGLDGEDRAYNSDRMGVLIGSGIGGLNMMEIHHRTLLDKGPGKVSPFFIPGLIVNEAAGWVSIKFGLKGPNSATSTACTTGSHAIGDACHIVARGDADVMVAGGSEGVVCALAIDGFAAMRALSTRNDEPERASRPFDADRNGFILGEGAGVLILEAEEAARKRGAPIVAEIVGYGMSGDA